MLKKYLLPFILSFVVFLSFGFLPGDCGTDTGLKDCYLPEEEGINFEHCTYKGLPLYGKIQFVENFPDIKVKIVENFPDIKVKMVNNFPDNCGEWQVVSNFPDLKVQLVENFPDIKVKLVENFPGKP